MNIFHRKLDQLNMIAVYFVLVEDYIDKCLQKLVTEFFVRPEPYEFREETERNKL